MTNNQLEDQNTNKVETRENDNEPDCKATKFGLRKKNMYSATTNSV